MSRAFVSSARIPCSTSGVRWIGAPRLVYRSKAGVGMSTWRCGNDRVAARAAPAFTRITNFITGGGNCAVPFVSPEAGEKGLAAAGTIGAGIASLALRAGTAFARDPVARSETRKRAASLGRKLWSSTMLCMQEGVWFTQMADCPDLPSRNI